MAQEYWEVVGGEDKGGIIVRAGKKLASDPLPEVLRIGSIVEELELSGNRLHFRLFAGSGPQEGWASVTLKQKHTLLEKCPRKKAEEKAAALDSDVTCVSAKTRQQTPEATETSKGDHNAGQDEGNEQAVESQEPFSEKARPDLDRSPPPKSEVKEAVPKSAEDWREEVSTQRKAGDKRRLARTLQDAATYMLTHGLVEEALELANDAVDRWELLGYRVPLGIAWNTVAKAKLQLLQNQLGKARRKAEARKLYAEAEAAASQAVGLLRRIEEPQEEAHLASARYTLAEVRALAGSIHSEASEAGPRPGQRQSQDGAEQPQEEDTQALAERLLETAKALLKDGMTENASQLAREAVEQYRLLGSRWQQGIAWDTFARTQLELLKALDARSFRHTGEQRAAAQSRQEHRKEALAASCKAVALLCTIGHPKEEKDLAAAQKTFDEVAKQFYAGDEVILAQTLLSSADSLRNDGKVKGALELASSAVEHYRRIGAPKELSKALKLVATIQLRLLVEEADGEASTQSAKSVRKRKERHDLALAAAAEAVKVLEEALAKEPQLDVALATARCTLLRVRAQEPSDRLLRAQELEQRLGKDVAKHFSSGDREALGRTLENAALAFLADGAGEKALELASSAAAHYQEMVMPNRLGIVLDLIANAHLEILRGATDAAGGPSAIAQRKQQALEIAKEAVACLDAAQVKDSAWEESISAARHTLERARTAMTEARTSRSERGGPTAAEANLLRLQRTFGYVEGLGKPSRFARFDIREKICLHVGGFSHGQVVSDQDGNKYVVVGVNIDGDKKLPRLWFQPKSLSRPASCYFKGLEAPALEALLRVSDTPTEALEEAKPEDYDAAEDSDQERVDLCHECLLPLGVNRYTSVDGEGWVHGECTAQVLLESAQTEDKTRKEKEASQKALDREEYNIGWKPNRMIRCNRDFLQEHSIPCPRAALSSFACCLALDGGDPPAVRIVETSEPEGAVNMAYLMLALQVRRKAGLAPFFSLDTPRSDEPWQVKTFGPPWLKGTCVGEVLFQADYHLKELSMGEAEQPVVGMPSVWDFPWLQEEWRGREWFVVRNATVRLSDTNILLPHVDIGVEARQQVVNEHSQLVDVPVTSKDHPLVKYAEVFTHNFDLIAERKSVFYQLREATKASILAKFLVDNKVKFSDCWLEALDKASLCKMEIPFNRLERHYYHVLVCDGVITEQHGGVLANCIGIYGGVDLNIDAFDLSMPDVVPKRLEKEDAPEAAAAGPPDLASLSQRDLRRRIREAGGQPPRGPAEKSELIEMLETLQRQAEGAAPQVGAPEEPGKVAPLGAEEEGLLKEELRKLSLTEETLHAVILAARRARSKASSGLPCSTEALINSFWESLSDGSEQASLLKAVFSKQMCDRRQDGDLFVPPVTNTAYLDSLRRLVEEERRVQEQRRERFLSKEFVPSAPGDLFPTSWKQVFSVSFARGSSVAAGGNAAMGRRLQESQADPGPVMEGSKPIFDKVTEDGARFRIYRRGIVEVRTLQEPDGLETVGVVFELGALPPAPEHHPVVKVTRFVRSIGANVASSAAPEAEVAKDGGQQDCGASGTEELFSYFVVYETDLGDAIFTEHLGCGKIAWDENPVDLEDRCARARVICAVDCAGMGLTVRDVREHWRQASASPPSSSRRFAEWAFDRVGGTVLHGGGARRPLLVPQAPT